MSAVNLIMNDFKDIVDTISLTDFAMPSFVLLWILLLFMPLKGVDRRDIFSALMYMLYMLAAGVTLLFALPKDYVSGQASLGNQIVYMLFMVLVAAWRWYFGQRKSENIIAWTEASTASVPAQGKGKK